MEQEDLELEKRVWQRIGSNAAAGLPEPEEMRILAEQTAHELRSQARISGGSRREMLAELARHCSLHADALRGMMHLQALQPRQIRPWETGREPGALPRAYRNLQQLRGEFERCAQHREYGPVFCRMERIAAQDLFRLLALIGSADAG